MTPATVRSALTIRLEPPFPEPAAAQESSLTIEDQRILLAACQRQWNRLRNRFSSVSLPSQEWEDIQSMGTIQVFRKAADSYDPSRGSIDTWISAVMTRVVQNEFRRLFPNRSAKDKIAQKAKLNLLTAKSMRVEVVGVGRWGEETVVIEPDIVDPKSVANTPDWADFAITLSAKERGQLEILLNGGRIMDTVKGAEPLVRSKTKRGKQAYGKAAHYGSKAVKALAAKYRRYLDRPYDPPLDLNVVSSPSDLVRFRLTKAMKGGKVAAI